MFEKTTHPFTSEETQLLRKQIEESTLECFHEIYSQLPHDVLMDLGASLGFSKKLVIYIIGFSVALVAGAYIQEVLGIRGGLVIAFLGAWFLCFLLIRIINRRLLHQDKAFWLSVHEELEQDLAEGYAVQWNFNAIKDAMRIDYGEDFGYTLMMDVGDDHTLFVYQRFGSVPDEDIEDDQSDASNDEEMDDLLEELPNSEFSIVYTARSNFLIDLKLFGEQFLSTQEIEFPFDPTYADGLFDLSDDKVALYPARLDKIRDNFQQWLESEYDPSKFLFFIVG